MVEPNSGPGSEITPEPGDTVTGEESARFRPGSVDEFDVIERFRVRFEQAATAFSPGTSIPPEGDIWIGDDAAVLALGGRPGHLGVWATDLVIEGVHVDLGICRPEDVGFKAVMVAVSDLAAMGAWPRFALVCIGAPPATDLDAVSRGLASASEQVECAVVGGDLSAAAVLVICVSVLGELRPPGERPLLRSGARPGDHVFVTGPLGRSAAGLRRLRGDASDRVPAELAGAYRRPEARIREGECARQCGASACIDVSDGLVADVRHLALASSVGLALEGLPVAEGATEEEALGGGEDYELVITTPQPDRLEEGFAAAGLPAPLVIGRCTDRPEEHTLEGAPLPTGGWRHRF